jgi:leader peptidase (prepilin peptidase)/N-methyltransferase
VQRQSANQNEAGWNWKQHSSSIISFVFYIVGLSGALVAPEVRAHLITIALFSTLAVITFIEIRTGLILNKLTYPAMGLGLTLWASCGWEAFKPALFGLLLGGGFFTLAYIISKGELGAGNVKLAAVIGAFTGWHTTIPISVLAIMVAGAWAGLLIVLGKLTRDDKLEFGPFLSFSTMTIMCLRFIEIDIVEWYLGLINE